MSKLTAQEIADKQVKRSQAAVADYKKGVSNVDESPTKKAALKVDKWVDGVQRAKDDNSYVDGCNSVSKEDWIRITTDKGGSRYASGVAASADKILDFQTQIKPFRDQLQREVNAMEDTTPEQRIQKMVANATGMAKFKYKKRRAS